MLGEEVLKPSGGELLYQATMQRGLPQGVYAAKGIVPALGEAMATSIIVSVH